MSRAKVIHMIATLGLNQQSLLKRLANTRPEEPDYVLHILNTYSDVFAKDCAHVYYERAPEGIVAWSLKYLAEAISVLGNILPQDTDESSLEECIIYFNTQDMLAIIDAAKMQLVKLQCKISDTAQQDITTARAIQKQLQQSWTQILGARKISFTDAHVKTFKAGLAQFDVLLKKNCLLSEEHDEILTMRRQAIDHLVTIMVIIDEVKANQPIRLETILEETWGLDKTLVRDIKSKQAMLQNRFKGASLFSDGPAFVASLPVVEEEQITVSFT